MNKRIFGTNLSATMNLPHQTAVLELRRLKEKKIHKKEKKEKKLIRLKTKRDIIVRKVKGLKKLKKGAKNKKEEKVYQDEIDSLNLKFKNIFKQIQRNTVHFDFELN